MRADDGMEHPWLGTDVYVAVSGRFSIRILFDQPTDLVARASAFTQSATELSKERSQSQTVPTRPVSAAVMRPGSQETPTPVQRPMSAAASRSTRMSSHRDISFDTLEEDGEYSSDECEEELEEEVEEEMEEVLPDRLDETVALVKRVVGVHAEDQESHGEDGEEVEVVDVAQMRRNAGLRSTEPVKAIVPEPEPEPEPEEARESKKTVGGLDLEDLEDVDAAEMKVDSIFTSMSDLVLDQGSWEERKERKKQKELMRMLLAEPGAARETWEP